MWCNGAGISDTRQLDSVLRSVDQAQAGLTTVFEALPMLERRSVIYTPLQLRQVTLSWHLACSHEYYTRQRW